MVSGSSSSRKDRCQIRHTRQIPQIPRARNLTGSTPEPVTDPPTELLQLPRKEGPPKLSVLKNGARKAWQTHDSPAPVLSTTIKVRPPGMNMGTFLKWKRPIQMTPLLPKVPRMPQERDVSQRSEPTLKVDAHSLDTFTVCVRSIWFLGLPSSMSFRFLDLVYLLSSPISDPSVIISLVST